MKNYLYLPFHGYDGYIYGYIIIHPYFLGIFHGYNGYNGYNGYMATRNHPILP